MKPRLALLAFDPGNTTGWAYFKDGGVLREAGTGQPEHLRWGVFGLPDLVVIENPRWYPHKTKGDVNQLLDLAVSVGRLAAKWEQLGATVELVYPVTWKGSVPKEIHNRRVLGKLSVEELASLPKRPRAKDYDHNCVDAVGLGLWKLGRMQ